MCTVTDARLGDSSSLLQVGVIEHGPSLRAMQVISDTMISLLILVSQLAL